MTLTRRQHQILHFIQQFLDRHGYAPSLAEIGGAFGLSSPATVHKHLQALEERGVLRRSRGRRRFLEIIPDASPRSVTLPLLGAVAAGRPIEAVEVRESLNVPEELVRGRKAFVLRVAGDSMLDEQIRDGDYIVVEERASAESGETVVALLHGREATLKIFHRHKGKIRLQPANPEYPARIVPAREVQIQGVVKGLFRRY